MAMKTYSENALASRVQGYKSNKKTEKDQGSSEAKNPQNKETKQEIPPIAKSGAAEQGNTAYDKGLNEEMTLSANKDELSDNGVAKTYGVKALARADAKSDTRSDAGEDARGGAEEDTGAVVRGNAGRDASSVVRGVNGGDARANIDGDAGRDARAVVKGDDGRDTRNDAKVDTRTNSRIDAKTDLRSDVKAEARQTSRAARSSEKAYDYDELLIRNKKKKGPKDVLSLRVDRDKLVLWKSYCDVFEVSLSSMLISLMDRFIEENPVPGEEELSYYEYARERTQELHRKNDRMQEWADTIDQKLGSKIEQIQKKIRG